MLQLEIPLTQICVGGEINTRGITGGVGFFCWGVLGFILGGALGPIQTVFPLLVVLYGIFNAFGEMGRGVATFLCASESFPTSLRGHYLGLAAGVRKAGAAIGTQVFTPIEDNFSDTLKGQQRVS